MLPWLIGAGAAYVAKKAFFDDDDYDDDYDDDSAERARRRARESKKDKILSDIKQYKKETKQRFKEKYGLKIDFSDAQVMGVEPTQKSIDRKESLEEELEELEMFIDELDNKSTSKINHLKRKLESATKEMIDKADKLIFRNE